MNPMKRIWYIPLLLLVCSLAMPAMAQRDESTPQPTKREKEKAMKALKAQEEKARKQRKEMMETPATENDVVYVFGVGTNFNDSVIYLTEIAEIHALKLQKKTKFLPFRSEFSLQLREYLEGSLGNANETCCMFYSDKRKKLSKRFYKLKKRYLDEGNWQIVMVGQDKFSFKKPDFVDNVAM